MRCGCGDEFRGKCELYTNGRLHEGLRGKLLRLYNIRVVEERKNREWIFAARSRRRNTAPNIYMHIVCDIIMVSATRPPTNTQIVVFFFHLYYLFQGESDIEMK